MVLLNVGWHSRNIPCLAYQKLPVQFAVCPWITNSCFLYNLFTKQISNPVSLKN